MDLLNNYDSSSSSSVCSDKDNNDRDSLVKEKHQSLPKASSLKPKGKKILGLASVLPQEIIDRWMKHDLESSGSSSDDNDHKNDHSNRISNTKPTPRNPQIVSLLSDLQKNRPAGQQQQYHPQPQALSLRIIHPPKNTATKSIDRIGSAFVQKTTTTVSSVQKSGVGNIVRNIHDEEREQQQQQQQEGNDNDTNVRMDQNPSKKTLDPNPTLYRSKVIVSAAPSIATVENSHIPESEPAAVVVASRVATPPKEAEHTQQKRSKKEMERALRRGQITDVVPDTTTAIDAANPHEFRLAANHPFSSSSSDGILQPSVKNAVTVMYDPSAGAAVSGKMGKSGKNQINQLLKSAVALERQRAEQQQISHVSSTNTHRANAKRKYGW
jgi:hypothetical protein